MVPIYAIRSLLIAICLSLISIAATAQTTTSVITGRVVETTGSALVNIEVVLTNAETGVSQRAVSSPEGAFIYPSVLPGQYVLSIKAKGFKSFEKTGIRLTASERLSLGELSLEIGDLSDAVTVQADVTPVQIASGERSALITDKQLATLPAQGRDYLALLRMMPGTVYEGSGNQSLGATGAGTINGGGFRYVSLNIDGVTANTRQVNIAENPMNLDAIAEVKVLTSNYQAEYGKQGGAIISAVTKWGTKDFHGTAYYYRRHESFNANNFFNNRNGVARPRFRFNTIGYNIGGPVWLPKALGGFNSDKKKLFFFFSQEIQPNISPNGIRYYTVPTELERKGNFSQSYDQNGALRVIKNPKTGLAFDGNKIPEGMINADMQKIFNMFPLPNFTDRAISRGNYNYVISDSTERPIHQEILRVDYNHSERLRMYFRGMDLHVTSRGRTQPGLGAQWQPGDPHEYNTRNPNLGFNLTYIVNQNIVNDFAIGAGMWYEGNAINDETLAQFQKATYGIKLGQLNAANNPLGLIPAISFGAATTGIQNAAGLSYDGRFPMDNKTRAFTITDGLSIIRNTHNFKVGFLLEKSVYSQPHHSGGGSFTGAFNFENNINNPNNTGYAFANALLGNFNTYSEASSRPDYWPVLRIFEWYAQDNWKVNRKLTLDVGIRFTGDFVPYNKGHYSSNFLLSNYDPSKAPLLYYPALDAKKNRVARDPRDGKLYPAAYIGRFIPGTGDVANGTIRETDDNYFIESRGVLAAPRIGFAYDVFGNGKTAIRGGVGVFNNLRVYPGEYGNTTFNPPIIFNPVQYYGNAGDPATFQSGTGSLAPSAFGWAAEKNAGNPSSYHLSLAVQRDLGFNTMLDVAYVGTLSRHEPLGQNTNRVPYGARFKPENVDPTSSTKAPLPDIYFSPYPGYQGVIINQWLGTSNYHALQMQVNRRFSKGLQFGGAYTWSKSLTLRSLPTYLDRELFYGRSDADRRHMLTINWVWEIPKTSGLWNNLITRQVLDGWQFSGIGQFSTGAPIGVGFSTVDTIDITGGGDGGSILMTGDPNLSREERSGDSWFKTAVFTRPAKGNIGNSFTPALTGPGITNFDLVFFKNIKVKERTSFQLRWEMYNAFNHTQWNSIDTTARFDATGTQINGNFGKANGARQARVMQGSLRFSF